MLGTHINIRRLKTSTEYEESKKTSKVDTERRLRWRADMYMSAGGRQISYVETHRGLVAVY